jgi:hypothetical protein
MMWVMCLVSKNLRNLITWSGLAKHKRVVDCCRVFCPAVCGGWMDAYTYVCLAGSSFCPIVWGGVKGKPYRTLVRDTRMIEMMMYVINFCRSKLIVQDMCMCSNRNSY